jgi:hypothetical protein
MATLLSMQNFDGDFAADQDNSGPEYKPRSLAEIDVRQGILEDLVLKVLYLCGSLSIRESPSQLRADRRVV